MNSFIKLYTFAFVCLKIVVTNAKPQYGSPCCPPPSCCSAPPPPHIEILPIPKPVPFNMPQPKPTQSITIPNIILALLPPTASKPKPPCKPPPPPYYPPPCGSPPIQVPVQIPQPYPVISPEEGCGCCK